MSYVCGTLLMSISIVSFLVHLTFANNLGRVALLGRDFKGSQVVSLIQSAAISSFSVCVPFSCVTVFIGV